MDVTLAMARLMARGGRFLAEYLPTIGMGDLAQAAARTLHFTGFEVPVDRIRVPGPEFRLIGNLLGSADILAQMADRCYLDKNINYARAVASGGDVSLLHRRPPNNASDKPDVEQPRLI